MSRSSWYADVAEIIEKEFAAGRQYMHYEDIARAFYGRKYILKSELELIWKPRVVKIIEELRKRRKKSPIGRNPVCGLTQYFFDWYPLKGDTIHESDAYRCVACGVKGNSTGTRFIGVWNSMNEGEDLIYDASQKFSSRPTWGKVVDQTNRNKEGKSTGRFLPRTRLDQIGYSSAVEDTKRIEGPKDE